MRPGDWKRKQKRIRTHARSRQRYRVVDLHYLLESACKRIYDTWMDGMVDIGRSIKAWSTVMNFDGPPTTIYIGKP